MKHRQTEPVYGVPTSPSTFRISCYKIWLIRANPLSFRLILAGRTLDTSSNEVAISIAGLSRPEYWNYTVSDTR